MPVNKEAEIIPLVEEIRQRFPEVALDIDRWMKFQGHKETDNAFFAMFEAFSNTTTAAIKRKDKESVLKYFHFMDEKLKAANNLELEYIDTYYVESLMWDINDPKLYRWGWGLMPERIKKLYLGVWENPRF